MTPDAARGRRWHSSAPRYRTVDEARILDLLQLSGWAFERRADPEGCMRQASAALDRLVALGLPFEDGVSRKFDPAEVVNFVKWTGLQGRDTLWRDRYVATGRRLAGQFARHPDAAPPSPRSLPPRRFEAALRRTFNLAGLRPGRRLRLRVPLPIEDGALADLRHKVSQGTGAELSIAAAPGRVEAVGTAADAQEISLTLHLSFIARAGLPDAAAPLDRALYLAPIEGPIQVTARVRALADHLAVPGHDDARTVANFWHYMLDGLCCGVVHYDQLAPAATDRILDTGWFDCHLGSALLVSLCRARSIPARLVGGYVLYPMAPTPHYWAEIWLEGRGWTPYDLLAWDFSAGGQDAAWRDCFHGQVDYRLKTTSLPLIFTGAMSVALPAARHLLLRQTRIGMAAEFYSRDGQTLIFGDRLQIVPGPVCAPADVADYSP